MLVFREVEDLVLEVRGRLTALGDEANSSLDEAQLQLLQKIVSYVNSMQWLSHEKMREKVRAFLRSRYTYREVAAQFGMSVSQLHKCISYAGNRLRQRIGGTLELLKAGNIVAAEREFAHATGTVDPSALFVRGTIERFAPPKKDDGVDLSTCERELSFLSYFSSRNIDKLLDTLDERKVRHLLYILLSTDSTYLSKRVTLIRCIVAGELKVSEAIRLLNEEYIYAPASIL